MDIVYLLIPLSIVLVFAIGATLWWAISKGQFDDLEREGEAIIEDGEPPQPSPARDEPGSVDFGQIAAGSRR